MVHTSKPPREKEKRPKKSDGDEGNDAPPPPPADEGQSDIRFFNFNRTPTALLAAPIQPGNKNDFVVLGSQTNIQAYNVERNADAFFKDSQEAVTAMAFGATANSSEQLTFVGGNCSVLGFDSEGTEKFWTVTSDVVTSLATTKWKNGEFDALLAGSEDYEIRVFKGEEVAETITESDKVKKIHSIGNVGGRYAVALQNGTVGVYQDGARQWRFKSKHSCTALASCDLDFDGVEEILCGWSNGTFNVRADGPGRKGEALFKEAFASPVNAIVSADYRHDGRAVPLVCTYDGTVRGYVAMETTAEEAVDARDRGLLEDLMAQKQALQIELTTIEKQMEKKTSGEGDTTMPSTKATVRAKVRPNAAHKCIDLVLTASEGVIRGASITGDLLFGGAESAFYYAEVPSDTLACAIKTEKDISTELKVSVIVGLPMSENFQVHDITFALPKFAMYLPVREIPRKPTGFVTGKLPDRVSRFQLWISSAFSVPPAEVTNSYSISFVSVRDGTPMMLTAANGSFTLFCDSMEICGALVQDLAVFLNAPELQTTCDFPTELEAFGATLSRVEEYNAFRMKLTAEMADSTQLVKAYVIKAEDARILQDMKMMKKMYSSLYEVNRELIGEYLKRSNNHTELLAALKEVNAMIQKAANLRVGAAKASVVTDCRAAIKDKNNQMLFKVIRTGAV